MFHFNLRLIFTIAFLFLISFADAQGVKKQQDLKLYYRSSYAFGLVLHTEGFGGSFKYQKHASFKDKRFFTYEFLSLNHPKQKKIFSASDNAKGFHYGKINAFSTMRFGFGAQHAFASKEIKKGVQIAYVYSGGFNLGFLRPIYLQIRDPSDPTSYIPQRYDPEIHNSSNIYGRASFVNGLGGMEFVPGIFAKFGLNFEYSPYDDKLKGMEVGVALDLYYKEVPMMYATYNNQYWVTFYLMFEFGSKLE